MTAPLTYIVVRSVLLTFDELYNLFMITLNYYSANRVFNVIHYRRMHTRNGPKITTLCRIHRFIEITS